ncbi:FliM/FliN family flagellar motor switch protein [Pseudoalteromonas sp. MMG022]|uniref:FliM/FliN family flagellar motor switch protein n=1 Tax=Pseudoalteromonas sp. MMG022 TaxID=2909978 RepID=UPI001F3429AE|nr:FliM/FliN family flagellar motor switch protein [Pseudoalteromonas sp. MMG022]MCF6436997.1 FliM/FliN family flagellar motor switch protein [Pseudoalteromonas sp. MMG022]
MSVTSTGVFDNEMKHSVTGLLTNAVSQWQSAWFSECNFSVDIRFNETLFATLDVEALANQALHESGVSLFASTENALLQAMFNCDESTLNALQGELNVDPLDVVYQDFRSHILASLESDTSVAKVREQVVVEVKLSWQGGELSACLDVALFNNLFKQKQTSSQQLTPLVQAAQHSHIPLRVSLCSEALNFVDVMCLKKGDVVMLKQEVEEPISIDVNHANNALKGYLVERESHKAIIFSES